MIFIHGGIYKICRPVTSQFIKNWSYTNVGLAAANGRIVGWPL